MMQQTSTPYFTSALPDEHYISYLWRCANLSGYATMAKMLQVLVGRCPTKVSGLLGSKYLADILIRLPEHISCLGFMRNHTQEKYFQTLTYCEEGERDFTTSASNSGGELALKHLRWCPACTKQDQINLNVRYWHNSHQDPRITRCQKHGLKLLSVCKGCRNKKLNTSKVGQSPAEAVCQLCGVSLDARRVESLTPFQRWMEQLHHLNNQGCNVNRVALLKRVNELVSQENASLKLLPNKQKVVPERRFIEAYNTTLACTHLSTGAVSFDVIASYSHLRLNKVLNSNIHSSPVMYALLGWVFLDADERDARFGFFRGGKAILKLQS